MSETATTPRTVSGWLEVRDYGEASDILFLRGDGEPLAERLEFMSGKPVSVRYWTADAECTKDEAGEQFLRTLLGSADVEFNSRYSELTGYLWTDETLRIGGHDLLSELKGNTGRFLILEVQTEGA